MSDTPEIYLLTMHSPSRKALRLWTGSSLHRLRHCSTTQLGKALVEMQRQVTVLQHLMSERKRTT